MSTRGHCLLLKLPLQVVCIDVHVSSPKIVLFEFVCKNN